VISVAVKLVVVILSIEDVPAALGALTHVECVAIELVIVLSTREPIPAADRRARHLIGVPETLIVSIPAV
jgi:hypothetical protein